MSHPYNSLLSERLAILASVTATIVPSASAATSSYVSLLASNADYFARFFPVVTLGTNGTGSVTVNLLKASDTNGTGAAVVLTKTLAATNATGASVPFDVLGVTAVDTSKPFIAVQATIDSGSCAVSGLILGGDCRYDPASSYNSTFVQTIQSI